MSVEEEIQKTVAAAIERALDVKSVPGLPVLGLLSGQLKTTDDRLVDAMLGMLIGSLLDRGATDLQVRHKVNQILAALRGALEDPAVTARAKDLALAVKAGGSAR